MKEGTCFNFYYLYGTVYPCIYIASITYMFVCVCWCMYFLIFTLTHSGIPFFIFKREN